MFKFVEAVFASKHYLYNTDTNTVYMDDKQMSYEEFDEEFFIIDIQDIDTYNFDQDMKDLMFIDYLYKDMYIQLYKTDSEKALEAMF